MKGYTMPVVMIEGQHRNKIKVEMYIDRLIRELKLNRLSSKVIFINFVTRLENEAQGLCYGYNNPDSVDLQIARTSDGQKIDFDEMMRTIAHEMVHAKQWFRGELGSTGKGQWLWKGRNAGGWKYENQPWEKEAYRLEQELYKKCWLDQNDLKELK